MEDRRATTCRAWEEVAWGAGSWNDAAEGKETETGRSTQRYPAPQRHRGWSTQVGRDQILESLLCLAWEFHLQPLVKLQFITSR